MKKAITKLLGIFTLAGIITLSSCTPDKTVDYIPEDAFAVAVLDLNMLWVHARKLTETPEFKQMKAEVEDESKEASKVMEKMLKDPNNSGLLLRRNIYGFAYSVQNKVAGGVLIALDKRTFEENLKTVGLEMFGVNPKDFFIEDGDIKYFEPDRESIIAYNNDVLLIVYNEAGQETLKLAKSILNKENGSITKNKDFADFLKNCVDLNFWASSAIIEQDYETKNLLNGIKDVTGVDYEDNYGHFHVEIANDELILTQKFRFNESIANLELDKIIDNINELMFMF